MTGTLMQLVQWVGIGLIGLGVLWESLLAPSLIGWGFVVVGFLAVLLPERRWPLRTPLGAPILLLVVMGGISFLITAVPQTTQVQAIRLWAGVAGFYGVVNWARDCKRLLLVTSGLIVGGMVAALAAPVVVNWNRAKLILVPTAFYERFPMLVSDPVHPNIMAALMALLFALAWAWFLCPISGTVKKIAARLILGAALALMGGVLLLTKSRGGYIAGAVGGLMVMWLSARRQGSRIMVLFLSLAVLGLGAWLLVGMGAGAGEQPPELMEGAVDSSTWAFRLGVWRAALWMLADFPFTGVGMGLFNDVGVLLYAHYAPSNPGAHNLYFQVGVDLGIPGLVAYLAVLMMVLWMAGSAIRKFARQGDGTMRAVSIGALAGVVALMVHGLVDIGVWGTRAAFIPWIVKGLVAALYGIAQEQVHG